MNTNREKIYSYSYLFTVTSVFSLFATEIFLIYSLVRGSFLTFVELPVVGIILCTFFSVLGQKISKVNEIQIGIFYVSAISIVLHYEIFFAPTIITNKLIDVIWYGVLGVLGMGFIYWIFLNFCWKYLSQRKIAKKPIAVIFGSVIVAILAFFFVFIYSTEIMSFFDSHPWIMTLIGVLITLLGGIFIGRRTKKI